MTIHHSLSIFKSVSFKTNFTSIMIRKDYEVFSFSSRNLWNTI